MEVQMNKFRWLGMTVAKDGEMVKVYQCDDCGSRTTYSNIECQGCKDIIRRLEIRDHHRFEGELGIL